MNSEQIKLEIAKKRDNLKTLIRDNGVNKSSRILDTHYSELSSFLSGRLKFSYEKILKYSGVFEEME